MMKVCYHLLPSVHSVADESGLSNLTYAWMVQQLGPYLAFEPWTWGKDGIAGYQERVMREEQMYNAMKSGMTADEKKEYAGLVREGTLETVESAAADWGSWIWQKAKNTVGASKSVKMVPVPEQYIQPPDPSLMGKDPVKLEWGISQYADSYTAMYRLISAPVNRAPGESNDRSREDGPPLLKLGATNEYIHPSVWWRYKVMKDAKGNALYASKSLNGFKRLQEPTYGSYGYWKDSTKVWIPEWFMRPSSDYLASMGNQKDGGADNDEDWEHAEWTYVNNVEGKKDLMHNLADFYVAAQGAKDKMTKDGKVFPWQIQCSV